MHYRRIVCSCLAVAMLLANVSAQKGYAQDADVPFDVFGEYIDSEEIYRYFSDKGIEMLDAQPGNFLNELHENLDSAPAQCDQNWKTLHCFRPAVSDQNYEHMVKSSVLFGELYDCGRCDRTHANIAGGVVISQDGLVLTNYHVLERRERKSKSKTEGFMVMTHDGQTFKIDKVLAASKRDDVAVVKLVADGHKFYAAPIAGIRPEPGSEVRVISNPSNQFFVMTSGEVSRYSRNRDTKNRTERVVRMEITADFAAGSSGSGVFNSRGEVVGLVSRIKPIFRSMTGRTAAADSKNAPPRYPEMILRRCVPLNAIHACFDEQ